MKLHKQALKHAGTFLLIFTLAILGAHLIAFVLMWAMEQKFNPFVIGGVFFGSIGLFGTIAIYLAASKED